MEREDEIKALKLAARVIKDSCMSRDHREACEHCPFGALCRRPPGRWDLDKIQ